MPNRESAQSILKRTRRLALISMPKPIAPRISLVLATALIASCGGGGGGTVGGTPQPVPVVPDVAVSGRISFDRVPFKVAPLQGLDFANVIDAPARGIAVEAIENGSNVILATATTNSSGNYSLTVPGNRSLFIRAKAQLLQASGQPSWNFRVLNNTNANALYALDGQVFNSGTQASVRDLRATSGWSGSSYTGTRAAAPFAILDTVYQAKELLLSAQASLVMAPLDLFWSVSNRPASPFNAATGNINSTAYVRSGGALPGIYIQGDFANGSGDTDEFDQSVIAHEFGHYVEYVLTRADSIGGTHGIGTRLDMRVAFSEGWGNAFGAMVLNDPLYRDSFSGANAEFNQNIESSADPNPGWFSEATVQEILWDIFDNTNESGDNVALGFAPIYQAIAGPQRSTTALTDLHTFIAALKTISPTSSAALDALATAAPRNITGLGDFATGESNNGGDSSVLPLYVPITLNGSTPVRVCSNVRFQSYNRLGNRKFLKLDLNSPATVTVTITAEADPAVPGSTAAQDPDAVVWRQGARVSIGNQVSSTETLGPLALQTGTYLLEVYDFLYADLSTPVNNPNLPPRCMRVAVTG